MSSEQGPEDVGGVAGYVRVAGACIPITKEQIEAREVIGPFDVGPKCPSCGARRLHLRPHVEPTAVCISCGVQIPNLSAEQEQRLRDAMTQRTAQAEAIKRCRVPKEFLR
jgi:hypothetical protein